jgi:hypothetical protein
MALCGDELIGARGEKSKMRAMKWRKRQRRSQPTEL